MGQIVFAQQPLIEKQPVLFPEPLSPRIANYDIDVKLDTETRILKGKEILIWHNTSSDAIDELQFHLYLNAFRNNQSTFMKESGGQHRGNEIDEDGWGFIDLDHLTTAEGENLLPGLEFIHPDNDDENDKTAVRVPLSRPIPPGGSIFLNMEFTAKMPSPPFARTGAKDEYFFVGQWFPKIAVYTEDGWNCHQFHVNSEFFADYGNYNVKITVPEENVVGATGLEVEVTNNGDGTATHYYHAEDVHDFAWTTSPEFVEFTDKAQDVDIRVLMQPDHAYQGQRHLDAAKVSVEYFQNWYGDYPFPNLTVVDPRRGAGGSGGMEYPTLITAGTAHGLPEGIRVVELVIIHEFGHNFWYHLLASNEFEESWMDEGINTYTDIQIVDKEYGPVGAAVDFLGIKMNNLHLQRGQYMFGADLDPVIKNSWEFYSGTSYGINSYAKPGLILTTLQNYLGQETMQEAMREYVKRWRFKHPKSEDFFDVVNDVAGEDLTWYFDQALRSRKVIDYSISNVFSREVDENEGFDFTLSSEDAGADLSATVTDTSAEFIMESEAMEEDSVISEQHDEEESKMYYSGVNVRRLGEFVFPVEIEVVFDNGDTLRESWDGEDLWKKYRYTRPNKLVSASVDPEHKIVLDVNYTNNSRLVEGRNLGVNKLSGRWLFWMQFLLDQPDFLNLVGAFGDMF
jgi:hypothetical protein